MERRDFAVVREIDSEMCRAWRICASVCAGMREGEKGVGGTVEVRR